MSWGIQEKVFLRGTLTALTGLRVGGTDQGLSVGGVQNIAIRHALLNEPYIPGSSLRGKMRCLLERLQGLSGPSHGKMITFGPCDKPAEPIVQLFGSAADEGAAIPSRVAVRDAMLTVRSRALLGKLRGDLRMTETKTEVCIDRVTSAANPRTFERVPAGAVFAFDIVLDVRAVPETDPDNVGERLKKMLAAQRKVRTEENFWGRDEDLKWLLVGLELLQDDAVGGQGSRGYGRVKLTLEPPAVRTRADYVAGNPETTLTLPDALKKRLDDLNARGLDDRKHLDEALSALGGVA